ncbi:MAG: FG-GAP-like repeat-containing protein [Thermoflexibacter sp.]|jgi:hypothetical protein|nr:FG-GAP-like repeat-containing protein [Thermoflexibacter sp.]
MNLKHINSWVFILLLCIVACQEKNSQEQKIESAMTEEQLAKKYCSSCHAFVPAELLPKAIWTKSVLPEMKNQMKNIYHFDNENLKQKNLPTITKTTWEKINKYFAKNGADSLIFTKQKPLTLGLKTFKAYPFPYTNNAPPLATLLKADSSTNLIYLGENIKNQLSIFKPNGKKQDSLFLDSPITNIIFEKNRFYCLTIGKMPPNDDSLGKLIVKEDTKQRVLLDKLNRPVFMLFEDLNQDGQKDVLIAEYGNRKGCLAWFDLRSNPVKKHIINAYAGNLKSYVVDMNHDGLLDIVSLVAQQNEGVFIYLNRGKGDFEERNVLKFLPIWGTTDFDLIDFDGDKDLDIILTNGDNADCSVTLKPYHGVRIFINNGQNSFVQKYFYPLNGAFKVCAKDYDQDKDIDLTLISFFPNYNNIINENFVYLENKSTQEDFVFEASTFKETLAGHWFMMSSTDIDNDGDWDLLLGALNFAADSPPKQYMDYWQASREPFWILENLTVQKRK